ncbi:MAG: hypothetical protein ACOX0C_00215 [Patescibacteria group bacterium]|jgi:hypothetical protein
MSKIYQISPTIRLVRDEASVSFHVKNNDYFGTIATVISLIRQELLTADLSNVATLQKLLSNLEADLMILQNNYQISAKIKNKNKTPKGKLSSQ